MREGADIILKQLLESMTDAKMTQNKIFKSGEFWIILLSSSLLIDSPYFAVNSSGLRYQYEKLSYLPVCLLLHKSIGIYFLLFLPQICRVQNIEQNCILLQRNINEEGLQILFLFCQRHFFDHSGFLIFLYQIIIQVYSFLE